MPTEALEKRFRGSAPDQDVWLPHYRPAWSSRDQSRAGCRIDDEPLLPGPSRPMQLMPAVSGYSERSTGDDRDLVPELFVDHVLAKRG